MLYNFDDVFASFGHLFNDNRFSYGEPFPPTNVYVGEDGSWDISLALAGYDKSDLKVSVEGSGLITIEAEPANILTKPGHYLRRKVKKNAFKRTYALDSATSFDFDNVKVTFENGLLTVSVPAKQNLADNRYIEIE